MINKKILMLFLLISAEPCYSQSAFREGQGMWLMFFNRTQLTEKWSIHSEIQDRAYDLSHKNEQLLIRAGMNYHLKKNLWLTGGYGYIESYSLAGDQLPTVSEHRVWQQGLYYHNLGRLFIEHRGRLEQRFVGDNYRDRVRYRLMINIPLNKSSMQANTVFISTYNEIFYHLEKNPYDRNRFYTAVGYQFNKAVNLQTGWLAQDFNGKTKGYLQLALFANLFLDGS
ncbi:DUF2490 domain-containing protein [Negadavirga shengliensis]|uniref:DUF2490 domain-containing protein n=1 Tax=Negadavirga shengliensis TaxID=1389218 RepID=A0ABV9T073_9BACT